MFGWMLILVILAFTISPSVNSYRKENERIRKQILAALNTGKPKVTLILQLDQSYPPSSPRRIMRQLRWLMKHGLVEKRGYLENASPDESTMQWMITERGTCLYTATP